MIVGLHKSKGVISSLIRWQTRGQYSHASIRWNQLWIVEAREFKGVVKTSIKNCKDIIDWYEVKADATQELNAYEWIEKQLGKPYDYTSVFRFISRRKASRESSGKWFCSELVSAACEQANQRLFNNTEHWQVSPEMLSRSVKLKYIGSYSPS